MDSIELKVTGNDGKEVKMTVLLEAPHVKTLRNGESYRLSGLFELANEGAIKAENVDKNTALVGVSKDEAIEMIADMVAHQSPFLKVVDSDKSKK